MERIIGFKKEITQSPGKRLFADGSFSLLRKRIQIQRVLAKHFDERFPSDFIAGQGM